MSILRNFIAGIFLLFMIPACNLLGLKVDNDIKVFYYPFELETFSPISDDEIQSKARCIFMLPRQSESAVELLSILDQNVAGSFDNRVVRLKVKRSARVAIYVDQDGGMRLDEAGKSSFKALTDGAFNSLKTWITEVQGRYGCTDDA